MKFKVIAEETLPSSREEVVDGERVQTINISNLEDLLYIVREVGPITVDKVLTDYILRVE
jgi:hypothetical protein